MPASSPPDQPAPLPPPERFNPTTLDHAVIAIPLLEKINEEKALIDEVRKEHPEKIEKYNCVIVLPPKTSVTSADVQETLRTIVDDALANAGPQIESLRSRHELGERLPGRNALFAWLDARVIRRILNRQDVRRSRGEELPLIIERILPSRFKVIIDLNLEFIGGREKARDWVEKAIPVAIAGRQVNDPGQRINEEKSKDTDQYVFATLEADVIARLVEMDAEPITAADLEKDWSADDTPKAVKMKALVPLLSNHPAEKRAAALEAMSKAKFRAIYRIWPDFEVRTRITQSISTVKANAAINSFAARGADITWAVLDTGIQGDHPHFKLRNNILDPASPLHRNFTSDEGGPLIDANGHGTHVAGIIAGEWKVARGEDGKALSPLTAVSRFKDEHGDAQQKVLELEAISGMAPECRLVSLKVLDENGIGNASNLIAAIAHVQEINGHGRRLLIHGMNISIGYDFDPKWFACGQSPLCVEVDRLVKSGVVVVVAAGNTGYGAVNNGSSSAGLTVTINDPGNAELAITVGSTHRDMPHVYGVSYFSSKGPTGDGRLKPDLVAPGEKIISCASALPAPEGAAERPPSELKREVARGQACDYIETSGTSMAAPHVSGLVAAFLSVRREFIGRPEQVKQIFLSSCTDLRRDRYFQGAGLIDLMRAIQSV
jgi:subtilisin family serine protease